MKYSAKGFTLSIGLLFWFIVNLETTALAQSKNENATLSGKVTAESKQMPLPLVEVFLKNTGKGDVSQKDGTFRIDNIPPGKYELIFRRQGYKTIERQNVQLMPGASLVFNASMRETVLEGEELIVTATRNSEYAQDIPQLVTVVTAEEMRENNIVQTPELLREEPGVFIQKTNQGGGSALIRGLKANKILLMIDGIRLNNATYRGGNTQYLNTIGSQSLDRMEVVHGPVSMLYGSDALGGAINAITKTPVLTSSSKLQWSGVVSGLVASAENLISNHISLSAANAKFGVLLDGAFSAYGDVRRGEHGGVTLMERLRNDSRESRSLPVIQSPNGFESYDLMAKAYYRPAEQHEFTVLYQLNRQPSVPRYDVFETQKYSIWHYEPQERDFGYLRYKLNMPTALFHFATVTVSFQSQYEQRIKQRIGRTTKTFESYRTNTIGFELQMNKVFNERLFVVYGFEYYGDDVQTAAIEENLASGAISNITTIYPDGSTYKSFGAFLQGELVLTSRWVIDGGLRYSAFDLYAPFAPGSTGDVDLGTIEQTPGALTGSIGSRFRLAENVNFVTNIAQGFRAPNLDDATKIGGGKADSFYDVPNADLGPEKVLSIDGGLKFGFDRLKAHALMYYSDFTDLLVRQPALFGGQPFVVIDTDSIPVFHRANAGEAYITGIELGTKIQFGENWIASGSLSYTYGQNSSDDQPISGIPPLHGFASLRYRAERYFIEANARFAGEQKRLADEDLEDSRIPEGGTPVWLTLNFRSSCTLSPAFSLRFGVGNIFDLNYREHLSGLNAPGRNFILGAELRL